MAEKLTEKEAYKRYIKAFGKKLPTFEDVEYWQKIANGQRWLDAKYPDGEFKGYAEQYFRACMMIACIEYEIEGSGNNADTWEEIR